MSNYKNKKYKNSTILTLPDQLTLSQLEAVSEDYYSDCDFYNYLESLVVGGRKINDYKQSLMPKRVDENAQMYKKRLEMFTYTNIIGAALTETLNKFAQGTITVDLDSKINKDIVSVINYFRNNVDDECNNELVFCMELLRKAMIFKELYVSIEFPEIENTPISLSEQINSGYFPYLVIYDPRSILIEGDDWYKIRTICDKTDIFGECFYIYTWRFVDVEKITEYTAIVKIDENRNNSSAITHIFNGSEFVQVGNLDDIVINKSKEVYHKQKGCPILEFELPCDKSIVEQIYQKQQQYTLIENGLIATTYASNAVQKLFKPLTEAETGLPPSMDDKPKVGNEYLLVGEKFEFIEMSGSSIETQMKVLENIERLIKQLVSLSGLSFTSNAKSVSSGYSKEMEFISQENSLVSYGRLFVQFYEAVINKILSLYDYSGELVNVSGLDNFSTKTPNESLDLLKKASEIKDFLAPTAFKQLQLKASNVISEGASISDLKKIADEITPPLDNNQ